MSNKLTQDKLDLLIEQVLNERVSFDLDAFNATQEDA